MPAALKPYRDDELRNLRGDDQQGPYEAHDRVYRYDVYNDLGDSRQILGGSKEFPYPRRCRTGRKLSQPASAAGAEHLRAAGRAVRASQEVGLPGLLAQGAGRWHRAGHPHLRRPLPRRVRLLRRHPQALRGWHQAAQHPGPRGGAQALPAPARQGPHPHGRRLPPQAPQAAKSMDDRRRVRKGDSRRRQPAPKSSLDPSQYGDHTSTITEAQIGSSLEGLTVQQAVSSNRLYILDHHDHMMPYLVRLNNLDDTFLYATRTLLFLKGDGTLAPVAIELSTPLLQGGLTTAKSTVYTPASTGVEAWIWQLAKAYVCVNDYGYHQLVSHWLNTHAVMEPFIIATNRQLSVTHPVHKLLHPHYRDTMNINSRARELLVSAGGIIELTVFQRKYAMEMSSVTYKDWNFNEQALPDDLIKRAWRCATHLARTRCGCYLRTTLTRWMGSLSGPPSSSG
ncbi:unnamed protein product [Triticum turgidum subsp. durum]|uniref:Lipoxygenase n=1 Tax=Triticum turgidum subsp. durum TaxID=4567 RepID=A0A9R0WRX7_TRITD|nr:unnamed protein product [Triticum turgidum subsp. durum]